MLFSPGILNGILRPPKATVSFQTSAVSATDASSYNFGTLAIGAAATGRVVIAALVGGAAAGPNTTTLTIGGVSATKLVEVSGDGTKYTTSIFSLPIDTGTSANVTGVFNNAQVRAGVGVWAVYGLRERGRATHTITATGTDPTARLFVPTGGVAIGVFGDNTGPVGTWTGLTERYDDFLEGGVSISSGADGEFPFAQLVSIQRSAGASTLESLCLASFR